MSEKKFTAKEAALAVLKKTSEMLAHSELAKGAKQKGWVHDKDYTAGVHKELGGGKSWAGEHARKAGATFSPAVKEMHEGKAKEIHTAKLAEMKAMPKPSLAKEEGQTLGSKIGYPGAPPTAPIAKEEASLGTPGASAGEAEVVPEKGHIKLAKFIGRMDHKRSMRAGDQKETDESKLINKAEFEKKETGYEKGVHLSAGQGSKAAMGTSHAHITGSLSSALGDGFAKEDKQAERQEHKDVLSQMKHMKPKMVK